jgi:RNA-splicing ligase RtcB
MFELKGQFNTAKVFTDNAEQSAIAQIENLLNQEFVAGSKIRIMPDVHAGMGCTIGTTMTVTDKVVPNLVGVDIGCGMETVLLNDRRVELQQLDKVIKEQIPSGFAAHSTPHGFNDEIDLSALRCAKRMDLKRAALSIGTLGGGNHFIELGKDEDGQLYLVIHSGSRNLGKQAAEHYQNLAADTLGRGKKSKNKDRTLAYLEGEQMRDYLHDMELITRYADLNRKAIVRELEKRMKLKIAAQFTTIHNYIDTDSMILRKGAVSAKAGEKLLIPMNMRDGSLLCVGKGNSDWNFSAPHGAGRLMSRSEAKASITFTEFEKSMEGIYSTSVNKSTIDESPFAYKAAEEIISNIGDTADVVKVIKPVYNFKAGQE